ncbi:MAG TPA: helix-turn-helix domain-containing protein [Methylotenera sp.]|nr:helix-turn-helix domain-containing protein [Methylotenera sp.]HPH04663.1 helix-turn-helix domain-containing protein [Methylotenera sp.]HPN01464.1 helix-turn-helix domain-containing protein [Methylotenera sp.]
MTCNGANDDVALAKLFTKNENSEANRHLKYIMENGSMTKIDAFEKLGLHQTSQRFSDLIKKGAPIGKDWKVQADSTGAKHRIRLYIWLGFNAAQGDLFGGGYSNG